MINRLFVVILAIVVGSLTGIGRAQTATPELEATAIEEIERLKAINVEIGNPAILNSNPAQAIEAVQLLSHLAGDSERIRNRFGELLKSRTQPYKDLGSILNLFEQRLSMFEQAVDNFAASAPQSIDQDIAEAVRLANEAVTERRHLYFGPDGGVTQRLGWAATKLEILSVVDSEAAETAATQLTAARGQVAKLQSQLQKEIVAANQIPLDQYSGADRDELVEMLNKKWAAEGNGQKILKVGLVGREWERTIRWEWFADAWQKSDKSSLQGYVIVPHDDQLAVRHSINFFRDHLAGDRLTAVFLSSPSASPDVVDLLLLENLDSP